MPTYEYECSKCGHHFEKFQPMRDEPLRKCPKCNRAALKRLVGGGAGLIFKGSGFYTTDYRKKGTGKGEGGETKAPVEAKPGGETKAAGDAKPAAPVTAAPAPATAAASTETKK
jgi:putative FmdB family regulatory protein